LGGSLKGAGIDYDLGFVARVIEQQDVIASDNRLCDEPLLGAGDPSAAEPVSLVGNTTRARPMGAGTRDRP
jgi:hypothetical protein